MFYVLIKTGYFSYYSSMAFFVVYKTSIIIYITTLEVYSNVISCQFYNNLKTGPFRLFKPYHISSLSARIYITIVTVLHFPVLVLWRKWQAKKNILEHLEHFFLLLHFNYHVVQNKSYSP